MQTFLPYPDFQKSASCLDKRRMWKQCVEASKIINDLEGKSKGWTNHPATKMWANNLNALKAYYNTFLAEAINRGIKVVKLQKKEVGDFEYPEWFKNDNFFASHRSNLLRKDDVYYGQFGWSEPANLEYVWPV